MTEQHIIPPENAADWIDGWRKAARDNERLLRPRSETGHWELYKMPPIPDDYLCAVQGQRFAGIDHLGNKLFLPDGPVFIWVEPEDV